MKIVQTSAAPQPAGHYSQGIVHNGLVFVSGQVPLNPKTGELVSDSIEEQTDQTLRNVEGVLNAAGSSLDKVLKVTVFISDASYWGAVNAVYAKVFDNHKPARAVIPSGKLPRGFLVEIEAIAAVD